MLIQYTKTGTIFWFNDKDTKLFHEAVIEEANKDDGSEDITDVCPYGNIDDEDED